jgi:hypothetical protein
VTLRGSVAQPLRHAFKPGMRINDLIPDRQALIDPIYYRRKNALVQYERARPWGREQDENIRNQFLGRTPDPRNPDSARGADPRMGLDPRLNSEERGGTGDNRFAPLDPRMGTPAQNEFRPNADRGRGADNSRWSDEPTAPLTQVKNLFNEINWVDGNKDLTGHYVIEIVFKNNNTGYFKNTDYKSICEMFDMIFKEPSVAYATLHDPDNKVIAQRISRVEDVRESFNMAFNEPPRAA